MCLALCHNQQYPIESDFSIPEVSSKTPVIIDIIPGEPLSAKVKLGKTLFKTKCASCHNRNMKDDLTGPALAGTKERWSEYPIEDLYKWIRNSQALIAEGHPRAVELWAEWEPTLMESNPNLKEEEIEAILTYVEFAQ